MKNKVLATIALCIIGFTPISHAAEGIKPGQWETTIKTNIKGMPVIPAEQLEQMKNMGIEVPFGDKPMVTQQCITPEQAKLDKPIELPKTEDNCKISNYKRAGNKISGDMLCSGDLSATGKFEMTVFSDSYYQGTWSMRGMVKGAPPMDQTTEMSGKWLKAKCDANVPTYGKQ